MSLLSKFILLNLNCSGDIDEILLKIFCKMLYCHNITYVKTTAFLACCQKFLQHVNDLLRVACHVSQLPGLAKCNMYNSAKCHVQKADLPEYYLIVHT